MCRPIESMSDAALLSTLVGPRTAANLLKDASGSLSRLLNADVAQQVSSSSVGAKLMAARLPGGVIHQYIPLDVPRYMRRFLEHWRPALCLICESEIWPNLLVEAQRREIPVVMVNGPVAKAIGMNSGVNALGQGNRANATIGRALQLIVRSHQPTPTAKKARKK